MAPSGMERVLDHAHNAVISIDERGAVTYWNPSAARMFGIPRERALGRPVAQLIVPERYRAAHERGIARFLAEGVGDMLDHQVELSALRADGSELPIEMTITALREQAGWSFTAFLQDISERHQAEAEREQLLQSLRQLLEFGQRRFDAVVGPLAEPITIRNDADQIIYANRAALRLLGFESLEAMQAVPPAQIMSRFAVTDESGTEVLMADLPSLRLLRGEPAEPLLIHTIEHESGAEHWHLLKASALRDAEGQIEASVTVIEDVSAQKRAERRSDFLARADEVLSSSLDYEQTLDHVAELAVPEIADWCAVDLLDADGHLTSVAVAHTDPARLQLAQALRAYQSVEPDPQRGLGRVLATGEAVLYPEITDDMLVAAAIDTHHLELLRGVGFRSVAIVPMAAGAQVLGAITLVSSGSGRVLESADVELAEQIANRAAVAVQNARSFARRAGIAHTLQDSLRPPKLPQVPGYQLASLYLPSRENSEVGGDFYEVWSVEQGRWFAAIGDVSGKGLAAASLTSLIRHTLRAAAEFIASPAELLRQLDHTLKTAETDAFCTAVCARFDPDGLTMAAGGHPLPVRFGLDAVADVGEPGPMLGALDEAGWHDVSVPLAPGVGVLLYTDGVTDALGANGERFGLSRLRGVLGGATDLDAEGAIGAVERALREFQVGRQADDTTALTLRRLP